MLHKQIDRGYRQDIYLPAVAPVVGTGAYVDVLGRLRGTGHFDLHQVAVRHSIHVVQSGRGTVTINGTTWSVNAGDAFLFYPADRIHYREDPQQPWRYTWVGLLGSLVDERLDALGYGRERVQVGVATPGLWQAFDALEADLSGDAHGPCRTVAAAWDIFERLDHSDGPRSGRDPVSALARIVETGYGRGLRIEDLARDLGIDRSTLFRRFREAYGCSPQQWLMQVRLDRAADLLRRGELTVAEVADRVGFADVRGFSRAFTTRYAVPPGGFRRGAVSPSSSFPQPT